MKEVVTVACSAERWVGLAAMRVELLGHVEAVELVYLMVAKKAD